MRVELADRDDARQRPEVRAVEQSGRLDLDDIPAGGAATELVGRGQGYQAAVSDEGDLVALLGLVEVLRGNEERPPGIAEPVELAPDRHSQERVDACRRLVEDEEGRIVDQG